jgi:methyl-accepting chemotaxis protein
MTNIIKTLALATCLFTASAWASDSGNAKDALRTKLRAVQENAAEVSNLAKQKSASADAVRAEAEELAAAIKELRAFVAENVDQMNLTDPKRKFVVETAAQTMEIIVDNKLRLINEGDYRKNRDTIRGKAQSVLARVKMIEKNIS